MINFLYFLFIFIFLVIGRYHLYISFGCPWACRTLTVLKLKGLDHVITVNVVDWLLQKPPGWKFTEGKPGCTADTVNNFQFLSEVILSSDQGINSKVDEYFSYVFT